MALLKTPGIQTDVRDKDGKRPVDYCTKDPSGTWLVAMITKQKDPLRTDASEVCRPFPSVCLFFSSFFSSFFSFLFYFLLKISFFVAGGPGEDSLLAAFCGNPRIAVLDVRSAVHLRRPADVRLSVCDLPHWDLSLAAAQDQPQECLFPGLLHLLCLGPCFDCLLYAIFFL